MQCSGENSPACSKASSETTCRNDGGRRRERRSLPLSMRKTSSSQRQQQKRAWAVRPVSFFCALFLFAFALQFSSCSLGSVDGYFHIRYSALLAEAGWRRFPPAFPWLPLTILAPERYADHHLLFHVWLVPFARGDLIRGAKVASALGAWGAFGACYLFLLWCRIRRAEGWMIALLAAAPGFLYRMEMPRVQSLSLVFLIAALALLSSGRYVWLLPLAWAYAWLHDAFPFLLAMCGCAGLAEWLSGRRFAAAPLAYAALGTVGGLLVNPYFPQNLRFIAHHYLAKLTIGGEIPVGAEWYPLPIAEYLGWAGLAGIVGSLLAVLVYHRRQLRYERLAAALVAIFFLVFLWRSSRFVEYFVPFATFALARISHVTVDTYWERIRPQWRPCITVALMVWLAASSGIAVVKLRGRPPVARYAGAARWIADHTPPRALVFNASWDTFPLLFFHNTRNRYVVGLDPTYLAERDLHLYRRWRAIANGEIPRAAAMIRDGFGASVAFTDKNQVAFVEVMQRDPQARVVYEDEDCIVYALGSQDPDFGGPVW